MHNHWNPVPCPPPRRPEDGDPIVGRIIDGRTYPYGCVTTAAYTADKAELDNTIANKVDKEPNKGLSTNDYTSEDKNKLSGIEEGANKTLVDSALSDSSINPVQNRILKYALDGKVNTEQGKGLSSNDFTNEEKTKLSEIESGANKTIVDSELSDSSTNPVQNKIVSAALENKADKGDFPTILISDTEPAINNCIWFMPYNVSPVYEAMLYANSHPDSSEILMNTGNTDYGVDNATTSEDIPEGVYNFTIL